MDRIEEHYRTVVVPEYERARADLLDLIADEAEATVHRLSGEPRKRRRATKAEMQVRRLMLADLAAEHGPCSVRHLFYRSVVAGMPGITKNDPGYDKVQTLVLELRRSGDIAYSAIVDSTRWMRVPDMWGSVQEALDDTARLYRRDLWRSSPYRVEVWCESDSIASTITGMTYRWASR